MKNDDVKTNDVMKQEPRKRFVDVSVEVMIEPMPQDVMVAYPSLCGYTGSCYATPQLEV